jgi:hypothetical protein
VRFTNWDKEIQGMITKDRKRQRDSGNDKRRTRNETDPTRLFLLVLVQRGGRFE